VADRVALGVGKSARRVGLTAWRVVFHLQKSLEFRDMRAGFMLTLLVAGPTAASGLEGMACSIFVEISS
jgi:hypothetical protein